MRKLFILTTFICSFMMSSVANAEWTKITASRTGDTHYVDFDRIKRHDDKVYYWRLNDYLKPTSSGTLSYKAYYEAECGRFRLKFLTDSYYPTPMADGLPSFTNNTPDKDWHYPDPDSMSAITLKAVCNHKTMQ
jgi:hypothetical protein